MTTRPKVLVVGDPRLADMLNVAGANWDVQPASPTVNAMWDAIEAGTLTSGAEIAFFSDGTGGGADELESTLAAFAPFTTVFVVAAPERAHAIITRAKELASLVPNGDPNAPMHALPVHDVQAAYDFVRATLGDRLTWATPTTPAAAPTAAAPTAPAPAVPTPSATPASYEQTQVYASHVAAVASNNIPKPANARPGQLTIASMSSKGGSGKCLHGDSIIIDPVTGAPYPLKSVVEHATVTSVAAYDGSTVQPYAIGARMHSGIKKTYRLTLASGREVIATGNHPLLTRTGWTRLDELAIGQEVATPGSIDFPTAPLALEVAELDLLAFVCAESLCRQAASNCESDPIAEDIAYRAANHYTQGADLGFVGANPLTMRNPRERAMAVARRTITARHGLNGDTFPLAVYRLNRADLTRFLSLYWMAAGQVAVHGPAYACLSSAHAADGLQHLLLRLGIQSTKTYHPGQDGVWRVSVDRDLPRFANTLTLWGVKEANLPPADLTTPPVLNWDAVASIHDGDTVEVFDIEVPGPANFVANDIVVHNSTTAALLAGTIAKSSAAAGKPLKVVLVDLDTRDGQVGSLIGKYMPTSINIRVMPEWNVDTVTANLVHDPRLGIDALLAPVRPRNADDVGPDFYRHVIGVLQTTHDVVILDCSVNYLDPLLGTAFAMSDEILFVTTLATTSVQGMARSLTELFADPADGGLGIPKQKVGVVANQVIKNVGMGKDKLLRAALGAPLVGQIPSDQDAVLVATNSNRMHDLLKHPRLGPAYYRLAVNCLPNAQLAPITSEQVAAAQQQQAEAERKRGLFRK